MASQHEILSGYSLTKNQTSHSQIMLNPFVSTDFPLNQEEELIRETNDIPTRYLHRQDSQNFQPIDHQIFQDSLQQTLPNDSSQVTLIPMWIDSHLTKYSFSREKKSFGKINFQMIINNHPILFSSLSKDAKGKIHIISTNQNPQLYCEGYSGFVRVHKHGERFTLYKTSNQENGDCDGEIMGISYIKHEGTSSKIRQMRIIMVKDGNPYFPLTKETTLSKLAQKFINPSDPDRFIVLTTKFPEGNPECSLFLFFRHTFIVPSVKNFLVNSPDDSKSIFQIFKQTSNVFALRFSEPFSPLTGFALAIAATNGFK